jgi:hypothetical protein
MKRSHLAAATIAVLALTACSDSAITTELSRSANGLVASLDKGGGGASDRTVNMMDACDPASFGAQNPPILCTRNGGVAFNQLIAQLIANGSAGAWHNAPSQMDAKVGLTLFAVNKGGEIHTFTKVAHFAGGFVPEINGLLHLDPAPECLALAPDDFILPGGADADDTVQPGTSLYQCCIHPWMHTVVNGRS